MNPRQYAFLFAFYIFGYLGGGANLVTMSTIEPCVLPSVSCMCLTYGRLTLLEEAIQSFLQQDYSGSKELIVLNDLKEQTLVFNHPEVKIVNLSERVTPLGIKRNLCAQESSYDVLLPWDDDDIYLPNRISRSVDGLLNSGGRFFKPDKGYYWNNGEIDDLCFNTFHSQSCFTRALFDSVNGYAEISSGEDQDIEKRFAEKGEKLFFQLPVQDYYYIYRWGGIEHYHLSAFGEDTQETLVTGEQKIGQIIKTGILSGRIPSGEMNLRPQWRQDYKALKEDFDRTLM